LPERFDYIIISWDTAVYTGEKNAFTACVVLGVADKKIYFLECFKERMEFPELIKRIPQVHTLMYEKYNTADRRGYRHVETLIEEASSGVQAIQQLKREHSDMRIIGIKPTLDKITRLATMSPFIENGTALFPADADNRCKDFLDELLMFPAVAFKDQCDALSQGLEYAVAIINRPIARATIF